MLLTMIWQNMYSKDDIDVQNHDFYYNKSYQWTFILNLDLL